jgi:uncharacterized protein YqkB
MKTLHIVITDEAYQALITKKPEPEAVLRIAAITEGCGCSNEAMYEVNWDLPREEDRRYVISEELTVVIDQGSEIYFEPELIIEFDQKWETFSLKNKNEIFLHRIYL